MTGIHRRPDHSEAESYYFTYIGQAEGDDVRSIVTNQTSEALRLFAGISEEASLRRYAPDKWSVREVVNHISDCERMFAFRAFWFARGFDTPLPDFDQTIAAASADAHALPLATHIAEFTAVRRATETLFANMPHAAWSRRGVASGNPFTVRAMAFLAAGHAAHHLRALRERYAGD